MLLSAVGVAALVAVSPAVVARLHGTPGFGLAAGGWFVFAFSAGLFLMVLGLTNILMPVLGELAAQGQLSPQQVADGLVRQPAIIAAFIGGNLVFLSWTVIGVGVVRSGVFPGWLGWTVAAAAAAAWLRFLHVPGFPQFTRPIWPVSIALLGIYLLRETRAVRKSG